MWIKVWITIFVLGFAYGKNFDTCPDGPPDYCEQGINCFLPDCVCSGTEPDVPLKVEIETLVNSYVMYLIILFYFLRIDPKLCI